MSKLPLVLAVSSVLALSGCQGTGHPFVPTAQLVLPPLPMAAPAVPVDTAGQGAAPSVPDAGSGGTTPPTSHGGSSGGGGSAAPTGPSVSGTVLGLVGETEQPLAEATVVTSDGRSALTDAQGRFTLPGAFPADGAFVAARDGYVASAIVGLDAADGAPTLHLKVRAIAPTPAQPVLERLTTTGRVVGPDGLPREGVTVVYESASGAFSAPATTDALGAFSLVVFAPGGRATDGSVIAVGDATHAWMGLATGVSIDASTTELDMVPTGPGQALTVQPATHPVTVNVDATQAGATPTVSFEIRGPGASLSLVLDHGTALVADVPGASYALRAEAINAEQGTMSRVVQEAIAIDFAAPSTTLNAAMLAPPEVLSAVNLLPDEVVSWKPVVGATTYSLALAGLDEQGFLWESYAPTTSATCRFGAPLAAGNYGLTITAWDDAGINARAIASLGPSRLRVLPLGPSYRQSSRQLRRSLS